MAKELRWEFPAKEFTILRLEAFTVIIIGLIVAFIAGLSIGNSLIGIILGLIFIGLHLITSFIVQKVRQAGEEYVATTTHLHVTRKARNKKKVEKIPLKKISLLKLDKTFLGGYILTDASKHLLFFNTKEELEKLEKHVRKHKKKK